MLPSWILLNYFMVVYWLGMNNVTAMNWVILVLISTVGISWSHLCCKWSGQIDSDDMDEG